ncbi:MAG: type I glyceraldehyde-3-phosphate dehydrogenase [Deltaproteobacteria bacterium]|nr:type I glyceraldehyde-3-phosphate dehydrogenase [Deltaproteobacteria bacterium]
MSVRVAINGFGRIGRCVTRIWAQETSDIELVAINDLTDDQMLAHLLKYDSVHRRFPGTVDVADELLTINGKQVKSFAERDPQKLPWKELEVDIVLECTGLFTKREAAAKHLDAGAKKVILSAPAKGDIDATMCFGINTDIYDAGKHHVISNASCTTNCLAPVAKVLNDNFGIESGMMTTIHAYTNDQRVLDAPHKDYRRARACAVSMIPTTTGAARAIGLVLPELKGKLDGFAIRVPTANVSVVDLTARLAKPATKDAINAALRDAANGELKGVLEAVDEPLVSIDFVGSTYSSSADLDSTMVMDNGRSAKVVTWYDNEMGYSSRLWDMTRFVASKL